MTTYEKLLQKFLENPENIELNSLIKILNENGFKKIKVTWSHQKYSNNEFYFILAVHNWDIKRWYRTRIKKELLEKWFLKKKEKEG